MPSEIERAMQRLASSLTYDFEQFTLPSFEAWLRRHRQRALEVKGQPWPPNLYGAWIYTPTKDFVFFDNQTPPVHQLHILLHEFSHMLCGHERTALTLPELHALVTGQVSGGMAEILTQRMSQAEQLRAEWEAECLASLLYGRIVGAGTVAPVGEGLA